MDTGLEFIYVLQYDGFLIRILYVWGGNFGGKSGYWTLDSDLLHLQPVTDRFEPPVRRHPDWDVIRTRTRVYDLQYPWRPGVRYPVVGFRLSLRRRRRQRPPPHQRRLPGAAGGFHDQSRLDRTDANIMPALRSLPGSSANPCISWMALILSTLTILYRCH